MQLIHSFWSKPTFSEQQYFTNARGNGGWPTIEFLWLSMAYSCLTARRHHGSINLVTDAMGKKFAYEILQLPYDVITTEFDSLVDMDHRLWAIAKLAAYKCQDRPFIHIDNDVYLWEPLPASAKANFLVAQNRIRIPKAYCETLASVFANFQFIPDAIKIRGVPQEMEIISAGIVGGNDMQFFQEYCSVADAFLQQNLHLIDKVNVGMFNAILDEYLFTCLVAEQGRPVKFVLDVPVADGFKSIVQFNLVPVLARYIHLVGFAKQNQFACEQLQLRFRYEFFAEYKRIMGILNELYPDTANHKWKVTSAKWSQAKVAFAIIYQTDLEGLLRRKVRLCRHVEVLQMETHLGDEVVLKRSNVHTGMETVVKLAEMDEALLYFQTPVCINELLEGLQADGFVTGQDSLAAYRFKLIDFVLEKIIIEGILEFA